MSDNWNPRLEQTYCEIASIAVLAYDIFITSDREVASIWKRKFSSVIFCFLNIRYATLICQIAALALGVQPGILLSCKAICFIYNAMTAWLRIVAAGLYLGILVAVIQLPLTKTLLHTTVFSTFRTWAIWGRHWMLLVIVLPINLVSVTITIYQIAWLQITSSPDPVPLGGCSSTISLPVDVLIRLSIAARASAIAADAIILAATWLKTWSIHRVFKSININAGKPTVTLSGLLLRDGTIYFVALLCLNIAALVLDTTPQVILNPISSFIDSFTAILLCRLILNLRSFKTDTASVVTSNARQMTSVRFAHAVFDNIGASVSVGDRDDLDSMYHTCHDPVDATVEDIVKNPLAIGLEEDMWQHDPSNREDATPEHSDGDRE